MKIGEIRWNARRKVELTSIAPTPCGHSPNSVPRHFASMPLSKIYVVAARTASTKPIPVAANRRSRSTVKDRIERPKYGRDDVAQNSARPAGSDEHETVRHA